MLLLLLLLPNLAAAQSRVDQLSAGAAVSGTDSFANCQGCGAATALVKSTYAQVLTYIQANIVVPLASGVSGTLAAANFPALTGDCTTPGSSLATTCTKTSGVAFATSATTDTTNAANISSGTLASARGGTGVSNGSSTITLGGSITFPAAPASTQCLHMSNAGAVTATGSDCGAGGGSVSITAGTANIVASPSPITGTGTISTTVPLNTQSGNSAYTIVSGDQTKAVARTNTVTQTDQLPQATGSFASGFAVGYSTATVGNTIKSTTSTVNGISASTGILTGAQQEIGCNSDGTNWTCLLGLPQPSTQTGTTVLLDNMTWTAFGTAGAANTGTSGHTLPYLDGTNNWSGTQIFGTVQGAENDQSGTTYTLVAADCGKTVAFSNGSAVTVTIPASIVPAAGTTCNIAIRQDGAGVVSVNGSAVSAATLVSAHSYTKTSGQHAVIGLQLTTISSTTTAVLTGDGA